MLISIVRKTQLDTLINQQFILDFPTNCFIKNGVNIVCSVTTELSIVCAHLQIIHTFKYLAPFNSTDNVSTCSICYM